MRILTLFACVYNWPGSSSGHGPGSPHQHGPPWLSMCRGRRWDILGGLAGDQSSPHLLICRCVASLYLTCTKMCRTDIIPWRIFLDVSDPISMGKCFVLSGFYWIATRFWGIKPLIKRSREKNILDHQSFKCTAESDLYFVFCIQKQLSRGNKLCSPLCILVVEFFFIFTFLFFSISYFVLSEHSIIVRGFAVQRLNEVRPVHQSA